MNFFNFKYFLPLLFFSAISFANTTTPTYIKYGNHPFYIGGLIGYGSTDWSQLTPNENCDQDCQNVIEASVPSSAGDKGAVFGITMGYEVQPHFAFEASFMRFPTTTISFTNELYYTQNYPQLFTQNDLYEYNGSFNSNTYSSDFIGKFLVPIMNTSIRGFADAGMAVTYRTDPLNSFARIEPTFGVGLDYVFAEHWMADWEFQYIAGYAKSNTTPAVSYTPFLYSLHLVLAYRF